MNLRLVPDKVMSERYILHLYELVQRQKLHRRVFWDNSNLTPEDFLKFMQSELVALFTVEDKTHILAMVWLTNFQGFTAQIHFCGFREAWGPRAVPIGVLVHRELFSGTRQDGKLYLKTGIGVVPSTNVLALKYIERLGYRRMAVVPDACYLEHDKRHVGAVFSYINRQLLEDAHGSTKSET